MRLERGEKGTNLSVEYGVSKQQISDVRVGIFFFYSFSFMFSTRLFGCSHRPEVSLSIIVKYESQSLRAKSDRNRKLKITLNQKD